MIEALLTGIKEEVFNLTKSGGSRVSSLNTFLISIPLSLQASKQMPTYSRIPAVVEGPASSRVISAATYFFQLIPIYN